MGDRGVCLAIAATLLWAGTAWGQAPPIDVTGASYAELDEAAGIWTLRGAPVTVRRGSAVIEAAALTYETRPQIVRASGGVSYRDGALSVTAPRLTAYLGEGRLLAEEGAVATSPEGTLQAQRLEAFADREEIVADGGARLRREDLDGRARRLVLLRRDGTATLTGEAVVRRGGSEIRAPTITIDLRRRRITATGGAAITLRPEP